MLGCLVLCQARDTETEAVIVHGPASSTTPTPLPSVEATEGTGYLDDDIRFLFDVVARQNESIVQNIDALDNALIAVAVGAIAIALFAADKWPDLEPQLRFAGLFFLIESAVCTVLGYVTAQFVGVEDEGVIRLADFAADFAVSPLGSTSSAIWAITRSAKTHTMIRRFKRTSMMLATGLAIVAAVLIVAGRAIR